MRSPTPAIILAALRQRGTVFWAMRNFSAGNFHWLDRNAELTEVLGAWYQGKRSMKQRGTTEAGVIVV